MALLEGSIRILYIRLQCKDIEENISAPFLGDIPFLEGENKGGIVASAICGDDVQIADLVEIAGAGTVVSSDSYSNPANNLINNCPNRKYALRPVQYCSVTSRHSPMVFIKSLFISKTD